MYSFDVDETSTVYWSPGTYPPPSDATFPVDMCVTRRDREVLAAVLSPCSTQKNWQPCNDEIS